MWLWHTGWQRSSVKCHRPELVCTLQHWWNFLGNCLLRYHWGSVENHLLEAPNDLSGKRPARVLLKPHWDCVSEAPAWVTRILTGYWCKLAKKPSTGVPLTFSGGWAPLHVPHTPCWPPQAPGERRKTTPSRESSPFFLQWPCSALYWQNLPKVAKVKYLQGPPPAPQSRPRRMDLELISNKLITGNRCSLTLNQPVQPFCLLFA